MGAGRDGGRDMYHKGPLVWAKTDEQAGEVWDGPTVFQAKHKAELAGRPDDNATWLWGQFRENSTIGLTRIRDGPRPRLPRRRHERAADPGPRKRWTRLTQREHRGVYRQNVR